MAPLRPGAILASALVLLYAAELRADEPAAAPPDPAPAAGSPQTGATTVKPAPPEPKSYPARLGGELVSDFKWSVNNLVQDGIDVVKSPTKIPDLVTDPWFYYTTAGSAAFWFSAYSLDEGARTNFRKISHKDAGHLESWGNVALWGATGVLYGYGLFLEDTRARQFALTGLLSTAVSGGITSALKEIFQRDRPLQNKGHHAWFDNGSSFVSGATTPAFALAADIAEYSDNKWYVAIPAYIAAGSVGLGRMGKDAHWLSDIAGSALLGVGTTELLLHMHAMHDVDPNRFRVFPMFVGHTMGVGVQVAFW